MKPVIRLPGSKYKQRHKVIGSFLSSGKKTFVELFGGTGIISINIKEAYPKTSVILNDFDNLFPLTKEKVKRNLTTFEGLGKYTTDLAIKSYESRVRNGLWDRVEQYNTILKTCEVYHKDYKDVPIPEDSFIYLDPPYLNRDTLYKNKVNHEELLAYLKGLDKSITWLMSYDNSDYIKELYKDFYIYEDNSYLYKSMGGSKNGKKATELWISNNPNISPLLMLY